MQTQFEWPPDDETQPVRRPAPVRAARTPLRLLPAPTPVRLEPEALPLPPGLADELGRILGEALLRQYRADAVRKSGSGSGLAYTDVSKVDGE